MAVADNLWKIQLAAVIACGFVAQNNLAPTQAQIDAALAIAQQVVARINAANVAPTAA